MREGGEGKGRLSLLGGAEKTYTRAHTLTKNAHSHLFVYLGAGGGERAGDQGFARAGRAVEEHAPVRMCVCVCVCVCMCVDNADARTGAG